MNFPLRILVVGPSWIGDMVMAQSLFIKLKQLNPECVIDVLAPSWSIALLERMPEVTQAIVMPVPRGELGIIARWKLGKQLKSSAYGRAIVLPNSWKSALTVFFADIPIRTGYTGECRWGLLNDVRKLDKQLLTMTVQRFVALATAQQTLDFPIPKLCIEPEHVQKVKEKFAIHSADNILALCPGAEFGPAKRWPEKYFAAVANEKLQQGWQVWLFGSEKDKKIAAEINRQVAGSCIDFSGLTSIAEAVDLMSLADTVLSNDSGLMHVAAALGKKIIAIYGSSDPEFTPPLNDEAQIISLGLECAPCFKRECPLTHYNCLHNISVAQVLAAIDNR